MSAVIARVVSVNAGAPGHSTAHPDRPTGIDKQPVDALEVRDPGPRSVTGPTGGSGAVGDYIGDRKHHGGTSQAVYLVASEELRHWSGELARDLQPGAFGENVTTEGIDVDTLLLGTRLRIGGAELEVRVPREPCATFAAHMGIRGWVKWFAARGRTGAYCAVMEPGVIRAGDPIEVLHEPDHGIDLTRVFRASMGDLAEARRVLDAGVLVEPYRDELARRVAARTR